MSQKLFAEPALIDESLLTLVAGGDGESEEEEETETEAEEEM